MQANADLCGSYGQGTPLNNSMIVTPKLHTSTAHV